MSARLLGVVALGFLLLSACAKGESTEAPSVQNNGTTAPATDAVTGPEGEPARGVEIAADNTVLVTGDQASFVMPSGNIQCVMRTESVVCQVTTKDYRPKDADLSEETLGDCTVKSVDSITIANAKPAAWTCMSENIIGQADTDLGGWWSKEGGADTETLDGRVVAVLSYGRSIEFGSILCNSRREGVSCRDTASDAAFTLSSQGYVLG